MVRRTRWLLGGPALVVVVAGAVWLVRDHLAVERDARAVRAALAAGRDGAAREPLLRWLRARPSSAEAHALMARVALAGGDLAEVSRELNEARSLGHPKAELDRINAITLARMGRYAEAEPILVRTWNSDVRADPAVAEALTRILLTSYRLAQARKVIGRWMQDAPADARPYLWLTEIDRRIEVDNPDSWERHYREALARDPGLDAARLGLAETLAHVHRNAEADEQYRRYLDRHPDDPAALSGAGHNAVELGDLAGAATLLDRALALAPENLPALKGQADLDLHRGDMASALGRLDRVLRADPFDQEALNRRAQLRARMGDAGGARSDREALDRLKRDQAELLALRGRVLAEPGNNDLRARVAAWMFAHRREQEGLGWAMAALASDPNHAPTCRLLADYYAGRPADAGLANFYRLRAVAASEGPK